jgi:hypothetical protein
LTDDLRLSFVGRSLANHVNTTWVIGPAAELPFEETAWLGALVVVEQGVLEVGCGGGEVARFEKGAILFLDRLPVRTLRNPGTEQTVLSAVSRRPAGA